LIIFWIRVFTGMTYRTIGGASPTLQGSGLSIEIKNQILNSKIKEALRAAS
jgi:hypothetical protein